MRLVPAGSPAFTRLIAVCLSVAEKVPPVPAAVQVTGTRVRYRTPSRTPLVMMACCQIIQPISIAPKARTTRSGSTSANSTPAAPDLSLPTRCGRAQDIALTDRAARSCERPTYLYPWRPGESLPGRGPEDRHNQQAR